jgi:hypothetical protein
MSSAIPRQDVSTRWPRCGRPGCGATHLAEYDCPPPWVWLVARFCPACRGDVYCKRHAGREYGRPVLTVVGRVTP